MKCLASYIFRFDLFLRCKMATTDAGNSIFYDYFYDTMTIDDVYVFVINQFIKPLTQGIPATSII